MNRPFTIAHISDLHISIDHSREIIRNTRAVLEYCLRRNVDHIAITGDICANAEKRELDAARKIFQSYGLLDWRKLSLVIGNHDVYGGVHRAEDILSFPKRCKTTDFDWKVKVFRDTFHEVFMHSVHGKREKFYPFVKYLNGVALFGINSIARYARVNNPIGSNGEVDDQQFYRLEEMLSSELFKMKRKMVLIHHHFNKIESSDAGIMSNIWNVIERQTMKLQNKKRLLQLFHAANVDLVLHGHIHENLEYTRKGIRFVNTGGAVLGSYKPLAVTFVKSTDAGIETEVHNVPRYTSTSISLQISEPNNQHAIKAQNELQEEVLIEEAA